MAAESGHWMPTYWADYFANTTHLTTEEHGAYLLMIGAYWQRNAALPDDMHFLASLAKMTTRRFKSVRDKLSDMFVIVDGLWYHVRVERELLRSSERLKSARANGRAGGLAKSYLLTTTTTEESKKVVDFQDFVVGGRRGEMSPENRLSKFHNWLAPLLGDGGWSIIGRAMDPQSPDYPKAVALCRMTAKQHGKGWPHQWPK